MKQKSNEIKCYNCGENHPASYKGCTVRKQLQQKLFPKLRQKKIEARDIYSNQHKKNTNAKELGPLQPGINYSQVLKEGKQKQQQPLKNRNTDNNNNKLTSTPIKLDHHVNNKLEDMIVQSMTKMDAILNILTAVIAKL